MGGGEWCAVVFSGGRRYMQICSPFGQGGSTQLRLSAWRPRGGYTAWSRTNLCSLIGTKGGVHADQLSVWPRGGVHSFDSLLGDQEGGTRLGAGPISSL